MSLARVVTFSGVSSERIEELKREIDEGEQPEGLNPSEMVMLHDPGSSEVIAILFFDSEEDYQRGHEVLDAMPAPETPGQRTAVKRYASRGAPSSFPSAAANLQSRGARVYGHQ